MLRGGRGATVGSDESRPYESDRGCGLAALETQAASFPGASRHGREGQRPTGWKGNSQSFHVTTRRHYGGIRDETWRESVRRLQHAREMGC